MTDIRLDPGTVVMVIDDDPLCCTVIRHMLEPDDVLVIEADSIEQAWNVLGNNSAVQVDVILLDRGLPDGDGIELLSRMRADPKLAGIPVIVQSGMGAETEMAEGIKLGAYHYLAKPYRRTMLRTLVRIAVRESRERKFLISQLQRAEDGLIFLTSMNFEIRTPGDVKSLTPCLARFFPKPENAALGLAELMNNAIEHGNLEIGYALKGELVADGRWLQEVQRRLALPEYWRRRVRVSLARLDDRVEVEIGDDGAGFDWRPFVQLDESRLFDLHGRGIVMAREMCFDGVTYLGNGNTVRCWSNIDS